MTSHWTSSGTHSGDVCSDWAGRGNRQPRLLRRTRIDRFAAGRIVEFWFIPDRLTLWQQRGVIVSPAGPTAAVSGSGSPSC